MNKKYIERLYKEVEEQLDEEYKVVLEPSTNIKEDYVELDCINWELEDTMVELVDSLKNNNKLTLEEKVLEVYKFICLNYIYDDNVLFFFKKDVFITYQLFTQINILISRFLNVGIF